MGRRPCYPSLQRETGSEDVKPQPGSDSQGWLGRRPLGLLTPRAEANLPPHTQVQPHQGSPAKAGDGLGMARKQGGKSEGCGAFCWDSPPWEIFSGAGPVPKALRLSENSITLSQWQPAPFNHTNPPHCLANVLSKTLHFLPV